MCCCIWITKFGSPNLHYTIHASWYEIIIFHLTDQNCLIKYSTCMGTTLWRTLREFKHFRGFLVVFGQKSPFNLLWLNLVIIWFRTGCNCRQMFWWLLRMKKLWETEVSEVRSSLAKSEPAGSHECMSPQVKVFDFSHYYFQGPIEIMYSAESWGELCLGYIHLHFASYSTHNLNTTYGPS